MANLLNLEKSLRWYNKQWLVEIDLHRMNKATYILLEYTVKMFAVTIQSRIASWLLQFRCLVRFRVSWCPHTLQSFSSEIFSIIKRITYRSIICNKGDVQSKWIHCDSKERRVYFCREHHAPWRLLIMSWRSLSFGRTLY